MPDTRYDPHDSETTTGTRHHALSGEPKKTASTLEVLRQLAEQEAAEVAEAEKRAPIKLLSPGAHIKLVCDPVMSEKQIRTAQMAALPKSERQKPLPRMSTMNVPLVHARLIAGQTREVWIRNGSAEYAQVCAPNGEPLDFTDPHLLASFGTADAAAAVRTIFVRDHYLLAAGQDLIDGSGWGEKDSDDDNDDPR